MVMDKSIVFDHFIELLPKLKKDHDPKSLLYQFLKTVTRHKIEEIYNALTQGSAFVFEPFGQLYFPYYSMGAVDTSNFFDLDEMILYSFYWANRKRYKNVLDLGANVGLHSILLNRCGYQVKSYEPDPDHFKKLQENLLKNECRSEAYNVAVSSGKRMMEFVRVLGNTTGSHLKGSKANPYGPLELIDVETISFQEIVGWADLVKMDIEGHEKEVILSTTFEDWSHLDLLVEVGNETNAREIFHHATQLGINLFSQKIGWNLAEHERDVPWSYKEGTLFMTQKDTMPWG